LWQQQQEQQQQQTSWLRQHTGSSTSYRMSAASWQKQLVYEFRELAALPDAVLLEDREGRLQKACARLAIELATADGAPQQQQLLVLLRLLPLPALIKRLLCARCVFVSSTPESLGAQLTPFHTLPNRSSLLTTNLHVPALLPLHQQVADRPLLPPQQQHLRCAGGIDSPAASRRPLQPR
jgi:hypothetical protein